MLPKKKREEGREKRGGRRGKTEMRRERREKREERNEKREKGEKAISAQRQTAGQVGIKQLAGPHLIVALIRQAVTHPK